jgi:hypothetical protein
VTAGAPITRLARAFACALLVVLLAAPGALAETRTALATDPAGDAPTAGRDITAVRAFWDSAGSLAVTVAFAGPVGPDDRAQVTANARAANGRSCLLESQDTYLLLSGYTGAATSDDRGFGIGSPGWLSLDVRRVRGDDAKSVTLFLDDTRIGAYDLGCVDIRLSADGAAVDSVAPVFFGDGTDRDGDGVPEPRDACPDAAAQTDNGCPVAGALTSAGLPPLPRERFGPPRSGVRNSKRRCVVPKLRGVSLAGAKKRLTRAGCRLGRVKRAGSSSRGRWVVRSQSAKPKARHVAGKRVNVVLKRSAKR